jgi:hypothetical protein
VQRQSTLTAYVLNYSIVIIALFSVQPYVFHPIGDTTIWWFLNGFILIFYLLAIKPYVNQTQKNFLFITLYFIWNVINIIRGFFVAETYWDWKGLVGNAFALMLPLVAYVATNMLVLQKILSKFIQIALPLFIALVFDFSTNAKGLYLIPVSFLLLFLPALTDKWKLYFLIITAFVISTSLSDRSSVIKFAVSILLSLTWYTKLLYMNKLMNFIRLLLFIAPVVLFALAITGQFNIFNINQYAPSYNVSEIDPNGEQEQTDLTTDTRTPLYIEVLSTAQKYNTWWFGRSPARGNETVLFSDLASITGREERSHNEVAVLNIFTWTGIVGVVLYMLVFFRASYLALNKSNNAYSKMLGLYIAFRWLYAWVEDINNFSLNYYMIWIMIGVCVSNEFRSMTDIEVKIWVRGIFQPIYRRIYVQLYYYRIIKKLPA